MIELHTGFGRVHRGQIVTVGRDVVAMTTASRLAVLIASSAVAWLSAERREFTSATGGRRTHNVLTMRSLLFGMATERPRVSMLCAGATEPIVGTLYASGSDVCSMLLDGVERRGAHLRIESIGEVLLLDA